MENVKRIKVFKANGHVDGPIHCGCTEAILDQPNVLYDSMSALAWLHMLLVVKMV